MTLLALVLYLVNVGVGLAAAGSARGFGRLHHVLYAIVCAGALAALWVDRHPGLWLTAAALAALPLVRARSRLHPVLAGAGLCGYVLAFAIPAP